MRRRVSRHVCSDGVLKLRLPTKLPPPSWAGWVMVVVAAAYRLIPGSHLGPCPLPSTPAPRKSAGPGISAEKRAATAAAVATVCTLPTPLNPTLPFLSQLPHTQQQPDGDRWWWAREAPERMKLPGGRDRLRCSEPTPPVLEASSGSSKGKQRSRVPPGSARRARTGRSST